MNKQTNDNAAMLIKLQDKGVKLAIITGKSLGLKGVGQAPCYEEMDGIPVHRLFKNSLDILLFPRRKLKKSLQIAKSLKPDLIFCSQELNMPLALMLKRYLKVPIVLLVEDAGRILSGETGKSMGKPGSFGLLLHGIPKGSTFWSWLCKNSSALITCHPRDLTILDKLSHYGKPVFYLPWPTHIPQDLGPPSSREYYRAVYVGSLYPFKNTQEFEWMLPRILKETCTKEFVVIGPGPHAKIVQDLQRETHGAVKYVQHLPRKAALNFIASSYYAYTPVIKGGWGFIGDCWSMKTPIVMTHNDSYVSNNVNALVAENPDDLIRSINRLYEDTDLYKRLQRNGYEESERRKAEVVSAELYTIFTKTWIACPL
jgi:glycosyltransferase involved in cell wall biosynthesis